jgi:hypothetical protein
MNELPQLKVQTNLQEYMQVATTRMKHLAKLGKHSAKSLPSVALDKESLANCTSATTSSPSTYYRALNKDFVECHLVLGKEKSPSR